jgi:hypothetical protein
MSRADRDLKAECGAKVDHEQQLHITRQPTFTADVPRRTDVATVPRGLRFRYVSFQRGMHLAPEFRALSRWGQVQLTLYRARSAEARRNIYFGLKGKNWSVLPK